MNAFKNVMLGSLFTALAVGAVSCNDDDDNNSEAEQKATITVENVLASQPLVQSGTFQGAGSPAVILPGQSTTITFYAAKGEALTFATMYGWSNDLFFAPVNPGIQVYDANGNPIEGDVSSQIKLWDNGTRINQLPGSAVAHPGTADSKNIVEVKGKDDQGNSYLPAASLVNASLKYNGNSMFTLTLANTSGGTANETPLSPGVWAVSYIAGGQLLSATPLYTESKPTTTALTPLAEAGNNEPLKIYTQSITGIFTPLSPILVVVYNGIDNPIYKVGENDRGEGLKELAQKGNADILAAALKTKSGVKAVYVLAAADSKVLLPAVNGQRGGVVSQEIAYAAGDRIAIATMYGFSNDWFFASGSNGVDASTRGDVSKTVALYDNGTAVDQFPGAGITQFNLAGTPLAESKPIAVVANPNPFTTLPAIENIIRITLQ